MPTSILEGVGMRAWSPLDWIGFSALWITVIFSAVVEALKKMPTPPTFTAEAWVAFAPLAVLTIATIALVVRAIWPSKNKGVFQEWPIDYKPSHVHMGEKFTNEIIALDDAAYTGCTFTNVTFTYNGTTPIQFSHNTIIGPPVLKSENAAVDGTVALLYGLNLLSDKMEVRNIGRQLERSVDRSTA